MSENKVFIFFLNSQFSFYVVVSEMVRNGSRTRVITEKPVKVKKVDMPIFRLVEHEKFNMKIVTIPVL